MSYKRPNTGNPELDKQLIAEDWEMLLPQLQAAIAVDINDGKCDMRFIVWTEKLFLIDPDRTCAWLRDRWPELNPARRSYVKAALGSRMKDMPQ